MPKGARFLKHSTRGDLLMAISASRVRGSASNLRRAQSGWRSAQPGDRINLGPLLFDSPEGCGAMRGHPGGVASLESYFKTDPGNGSNSLRPGPPTSTEFESRPMKIMGNKYGIMAKKVHRIRSLSRLSRGVRGVVHLFPYRGI